MKKPKENIFFFIFDNKSNKHRPLNKAVGPGKKPKINKHVAYVYS